MTHRIIKQRCPRCGRMVETLFSDKKLYDSCSECNPSIAGRTLPEALHDLNEKRGRKEHRT